MMGLLYLVIFFNFCDLSTKSCRLIVMFYHFCLLYLLIFFKWRSFQLELHLNRMKCTAAIQLFCIILHRLFYLLMMIFCTWSLVSRKLVDIYPIISLSFVINLFLFAGYLFFNFCPNIVLRSFLRKPDVNWSRYICSRSCCRKARCSSECAVKGILRKRNSVRYRSAAPLARDAWSPRLFRRCRW